MLSIFEGAVKEGPERTCLTFVEREGEESIFAYHQMRMMSASLALLLRDRGVRPGDCVFVDLPNCPLYALLVLAAAYGGFSLAAIDNCLSSSEKVSRLLELDRLRDMNMAYHVDETNADMLFARARDIAEGQVGWSDFNMQESSLDEILAEQDSHYASTFGKTRKSFFSRKSRGSGASVPTSRSTGRSRARREMNYRKLYPHDAEDTIIHFAERAAHTFDRDARAIVVFSAGSLDQRRIVALSWRKLLETIESADRALPEVRKTVHQIILPLSKISALRSFLHGLIRRGSFVLYRTTDFDFILQNASLCKATNVTIDEVLLQELLSWAARMRKHSGDHVERAENREEDDSSQTRNRHAILPYQVIVLVGRAPNLQTIKKAKQYGLPIFAVYGMTETAGAIALCPLDRYTQKGLKVLDGYSVQIVDPSPSGYGLLAIKGPSVFDGYLNAQDGLTVDGLFVTDDTAKVVDGRLFVKERTEDMFSCAGQTVFPTELASLVVDIDGVSDACVFGVSDAILGKRPVGFIELDSKTGETINRAALINQVKSIMRSHLPQKCLLDDLFVLDAFPRIPSGETDRTALESCYLHRIDVCQVELFCLRVPLVSPVEVPRGVRHNRTMVVVRVMDSGGREGLGECVPPFTGTGFSETIEQDVYYLKKHLSRIVLDRTFLEPADVSRALLADKEAEAYPYARAAMETALWDLHGKITHRPMWRMLDGDVPDLGARDIVRKATSCMGSQEDVAGLSGAKMSRDSRTARGQRASGASRDDRRVLNRLSGNAVFSSPGATGPVVHLDLQGSHDAIDFRIDVLCMAKARRCPDRRPVDVVRELVDAGYDHVCVDVEPGSAMTTVRTIREAFPELVLSVDAGQRFTEDGAEELGSLTAFDVSFIKDPISSLGGNRRGLFSRIADLQGCIAIPICLDASLRSLGDAYEALRFSQLRCFAVDVGKFGGIAETKAFMKAAKSCRAMLMMGDSQATGISRLLHASLQTDVAVSIPGEIGSADQCFAADIVQPAYRVERGWATLNRGSQPYGLGCLLDLRALEAWLVNYIQINP